MIYEKNLRIKFTWQSPDEDIIGRERLHTLESIATSEIIEKWDKGETKGQLLVELFEKRYHCDWSITPMEVFE